jgi:hypothetical protein
MSKNDPNEEDYQTKSNLEKFFDLRNRTDTKQSEASKGSQPSKGTKAIINSNIIASESSLLSVPVHDPILIVPDIKPKTPIQAKPVKTEPYILPTEEQDPQNDQEVFQLLNKEQLNVKLSILNQPEHQIHHSKLSERGNIINQNGLDKTELFGNYLPIVGETIQIEGRMTKPNNKMNKDNNLCSDDTFYDLDNASETSVFYKNDFFEKEYYYTATEKVPYIKNQLLIKDRMVKNFQNKRVIAMPKLIKDSYRKTKMAEILTTKTIDPVRKAELYYDSFPLLKLRRNFIKYMNIISYYCYSLVKQKWFDNISLLIIILNTLLILISDPKDDNSIANVSDNYFLYIYTIEMFLKIFAYGFIIKEGSYIRDSWNILDFLVIVLGWVSIILESGNSGGSGVKGISGLRAFRILRPLKTVKSIKGLRNLIVTILESVGELGDIAIIMFFSFLIFSIAGVQMWQGLFMYRCVSNNSGIVDSYKDWSNSCTFDTDCQAYSLQGNEYSCKKTYINPFNNVLNYDNVINGLLTVYQICTMEGWTDIWGYISRTFKDANGINLIIIFLYFHVLIFICGYFLINLCLAVIMNFFTEIKERKEVIPRRTFKRNFQDLYEEKKELKIIDDDALENELEKIKKEVGGIEKEEVPLTYYTLKDIYRLYNETPENINTMKRKILYEAKNALNEFKIKEKELKEKFKNMKKQISEKNTEQRIQEQVTRMTELHKKSQSIDTFSEEILKHSIKDTMGFMQHLNQKLKTTTTPSPRRFRKISKKKKNEISYIKSESEEYFNDDASEQGSFISNFNLGTQENQDNHDGPNGGQVITEYNLSKESCGDEKFLSLVEERTNNEQNYNLMQLVNKRKIKLSKSFKYSYEHNLLKHSYKTMKDLNIEALQNGAATVKVYRRSKSQEFRDPGFKENPLQRKMDELFINPRGRRNSITKSYWKFPNVQTSTKESNLRSIAKHVTSFRKYMSYTFNLLDKDLHIKDDFTINLNVKDVFPIAIAEQKANIVRIDKEDSIRFFNKTRVYSYEYNKYVNYDLAEEEFIHINHNLKYLTPDIITKIGYKTNKTLETINKGKSSTIVSISNRSSNISSTNVNLSASMRTSKVSKIKTSSKSCPSFNFDDQRKKLMTFNHNLYMKINGMNFKTFNKYFDMEEQVYQSIKDYVPNSEKEINPRDMFDIKREVEKIRQHDYETGIVKHVEWSANEILRYDLSDEKHYTQWNGVMAKLQSLNIILWNENSCIGIFQKIKYILHKISVAQWFDILIISVVIFNAIIMAIDGNMLDPDTLVQIANINYAFNAIYILEFIIKFIGLGPFIYLSDPTTYLDILIIGFAILDMTTNSDGSKGSAVSSKLAFLRVFRIFRVIRLMKVLKKVKTMRLIMSGISQSITNVGYVTLIMIMFILIFQLLGMSLLNNIPEYSTFMSSFYTTFNLVTLENWNQLLIELSYVNRATALFLIVWIFIGAYIIFNLFISILLSSFDDFGENDTEIIFPENYPHLFQRHELAEYGYHKKLEKLKNKKEDKIEEATEEEEEKAEMGNSEMIDLDNFKGTKQGYLKEWQAINQIFKDNNCERSLFVFSQTNRVRVYCMGLITWKRFDQFIMVIILISTLRLMLDTFIDSSVSSTVFDILDIIFTMIFISEMVLKVISLGFIMDEGSYLHDNWNRIDFLIVIVSLIDLENLVNKFNGSQAGAGALGFLKVLRLLRTLRPLRFISKNVQLKLIITSLFDSIEAILGVLAIVLVIFFAFSIVGMNLFYDLYSTCYMVSNPYNLPILTFKDDLAAKGIGSTDYQAIFEYVNNFNNSVLV